MVTGQVHIGSTQSKSGGNRRQGRLGSGTIYGSLTHANDKDALLTIGLLAILPADPGPGRARLDPNADSHPDSIPRPDTSPPCPLLL